MPIIGAEKIARIELFHHFIHPASQASQVIGRHSCIYLLPLRAALVPRWFGKSTIRILATPRRTTYHN